MVTSNNVPYGRTIGAYDLAGLYLTRAGIPDNGLTRRILAAWFMSESRRVGASGIQVYNYNPLNITTTDSSTPWHYLTGKNGQYLRDSHGNIFMYRSFDTPQQGADAWYALMQKRYPGMLTALRHADPVAFAYALGHAPWGTNSKTFISVFNSLPKTNSENFGNIPTGGPTDTGGAPPSDSAGAAPTPGGVTGAFWMNGSPLVVFENGHVLTKNDVEDIVNTLDHSGFVPSADPITRAAALDGIRQVLMKHVGERWSSVLVAQIAVEIQAAAWNDNTLGRNLVQGADVVGQGIASSPLGLLDPTKLPGRLLHITAIIIGLILIGYGGKRALDSAESGSSDNTTTVVRYPLISKG